MRFSHLFLAGLLIRAASAYALTPEELGFEASNKLTCEVTATAVLLPGELVEYGYALFNSSASLQPIGDWGVQVDTAVSVEDMAAPTEPLKWIASGCCVVDEVRRSSTGIRVTQWVIDADDALIPPGIGLSGFKIKVRSLPAAKRFFVRGFTDNDIPEGEFTEEESREIRELVTFFNNSFSGFTIGPDPIPAVIVPEALIDRLVALKHQSVSLGWLRGDELVRKLDRRLEQAKKALAENKPFKARKKLEQFIQALEQQRKEREKRRHEASEKGQEKRAARSEEDKRFLDDNAFFLLRVNAEFITSKLPGEAKDRGEAREAEDDQDE